MAKATVSTTPSTPFWLHPSPKQTKYMESLLIDNYLSNRKERNAWLTSQLGRDIHNLDDMTMKEATGVIELLITRKSEKYPAGVVLPAAEPCDKCERRGLICGECEGGMRACKEVGTHRWKPKLCDECSGKRYV